MNLKFIRFFIIGAFALFSIQLSAQKTEKAEYKGEIGVSGGGSYYIGETNSILFNNMRPAYSGFFKYWIDTRFAIRAELTRATIAGSGITDNTINVGDICCEFNFFDLEINQYKRYSKTFSPYIFGGMSLLSDIYTNQNSLEIGIPFGVGFKVKLNNRWNFVAQWSNRLLIADNLEGYTDPFTPGEYNNRLNLNGSNLLNNDLHSTLTIGISYNILKKRCKCLDVDKAKNKRKYSKTDNKKDKKDDSVQRKN